MKIVFILVFLFPYLAKAKDLPKSLSCSSGGTAIIYVNGVWNSKEDANDSTEKIRDLIRLLNSKLDARSVVSLELSYNTSEGKIRDIKQLLRQKLAGQRRFTNIEIDFLTAAYFFDLSDFITYVGRELYLEIEEKKMLMLAEEDSNSSIDTWLLTEKIKGHLYAGRKVIVVTHSQGGIYANMAYDQMLRMGVPLETLNKFYGNLQLATVAKSLRAKNSIYVTHNFDTAIQHLISAKKSVLAPNYKSTDICLSNDISCHRFVETYLSTNFFANGPQQGRGDLNRKLQSVFLDGLEEVAWKLANNDNACCNGRDGRFHRNDYESSPDGFVESSVLVDPKLNLQIESQQVCGAVEFRSFSKGNKIVVNRFFNIEAESPIRLTGNIYLKAGGLKNSSGLTQKISNESSSPLVVDGGVRENAVVEGPLYLYGATIEGPSIIKGEIYEPAGSSDVYAPFIVASRITGNSATSGNFMLIRKNIHNSRIYGSVTPFGENLWRNTFIGLEGTPSWDNVTIDGNVYVTGTVESGSTLTGYSIESNANGIVINENAKVKSNSTITGSALLDRFAEYLGNWNGDIDPQGKSGYLRAGTVEASIAGAPKISTFSIGTEVNSQTKSTITGYPTIVGSYLNGSNVSCDAKVVDEVVFLGSFGCGYVSSSPHTTDFDSGMNNLLNLSYNQILEFRNILQQFSTQAYAEFENY